MVPVAKSGAVPDDVPAEFVFSKCEYWTFEDSESQLAAQEELSAVLSK
jgi:hypothetical protein